MDTRRGDTNKIDHVWLLTQSQYAGSSWGPEPAMNKPSISCQPPTASAGQVEEKNSKQHNHFDSEKQLEQSEEQEKVRHEREKHKLKEKKEKPHVVREHHKDSDDSPTHDKREIERRSNRKKRPHDDHASKPRATEDPQMPIMRRMAAEARARQEALAKHTNSPLSESLGGTGKDAGLNSPHS